MNTLKDTLKAKGWSYRRAAQYLGCTYQHISEVCNGGRTSARLAQRIMEMPHSTVPHGFSNRKSWKPDAQSHAAKKATRKAGKGVAK